MSSELVKSPKSVRTRCIFGDRLPTFCVLGDLKLDVVETVVSSSLRRGREERGCLRPQPLAPELTLIKGFLGPTWRPETGITRGQGWLANMR